QDVFITKIDSSDIIELVENGTFLWNKPIMYEMIEKKIKPNFDDSIDVITLASTHLNFIKNYLSDLLPSLKFVDSSVQVAKDAKDYLRSNQDLVKNGTGKLEILVSSDKKNFQTVLRYMGIKEIIYDVSLQF
ncbi:MAG TPA: hypothetical protein VN704_07225, partial [Verrucomicrobiae bacterium]|nr:hypothetical protein [Verrucomicrobiae bacterium]